MMKRNKKNWPIFDSEDWEYLGTRYPWYKFIKRGCDEDESVSIQYVSCAQYIQYAEDGVVECCLLCEPLLPKWRDYSNYLG